MRLAAMAPMASASAQPAPRATTPAPWRTQLGKESRLPNLYYGAISPGSLRRLSNFTALPPPEQLCLGPWEGCYRYVRQDSQLWTALHGGRLTTSRLKDALGLRDRTAARLVGGPQAAEEGVKKAYQHLTGNPLFRPAVSGAAAAGTSGGEGPPPPRDEAEALARNEAARLRYNEELEAAAAGQALQPEPGWDEADRRRISELAALAVGASGGSRMRLLWGTLQESAAVATVGLLFPESQLEEVGLLCLTDTSRWGVDAAELPPLGASPDALITHVVQVTHGDIQAARAALAASGALASGEAAAAAAARAAACEVLRAALERHTRQAAAVWADDSQSPQATQAASAPSGNDASCSSSSSSSGNGSSSSPARPQVRPLHCNTTEEAEAWLAQQLLLRPAPAATAASAAGSGSGSSGGGGGSSTGVAAVVRIREVVEVKNHCPFIYKDQRKARKRGVVINYAASDRGPVSGLWPLWVPQLQAHMAAAGTHSGLLLSRSPSRGVKLFRVYRDDAFLTSAWELVRELQTSHVVRGVPPGPDPWSGRPGYGGLIERVVGLAAGAQVVVETRGTPLLAGADPDAFWKMR